ncbi:hypothetical protein BS78_05G285800 [Paspalum vaginatum]|nr:hypothetical protein BS78_05G285800 [Paspalum vaginatum]
MASLLHRAPQCRPCTPPAPKLQQRPSSLLRSPTSSFPLAIPPLSWCPVSARRKAPTGQQQVDTCLSMPKLQPGISPSDRKYSPKVISLLVSIRFVSLSCVQSHHL